MLYFLKQLYSRLNLVRSVSAWAWISGAYWDWVCVMPQVSRTNWVGPLNAVFWNAELSYSFTQHCVLGCVGVVANEFWVVRCPSPSAWCIQPSRSTLGNSGSVVPAFEGLISASPFFWPTLISSLAPLLMWLESEGLKCWGPGPILGPSPNPSSTHYSFIYCLNHVEEHSLPAAVWSSFTYWTFVSNVFLQNSSPGNWEA